jgi:hypothetical protein
MIRDLMVLSGFVATAFLMFLPLHNHHIACWLFLHGYTISLFYLVAPTSSSLLMNTPIDNGTFIHYRPAPKHFVHFIFFMMHVGVFSLIGATIREYGGIDEVFSILSKRHWTVALWATMSYFLSQWSAPSLYSNLFSIQWHITLAATVTLIAREYHRIHLKQFDYT